MLASKSIGLIDERIRDPGRDPLLRFPAFMQELAKCAKVTLHECSAHMIGKFTDLMQRLDSGAGSLLHGLFLFVEKVP